VSGLPRVALVVPSFAEGGGVPVVGLFLERIIRESQRYAVDVISLAMSSRDGASVRLLSPASWLTGITIEDGVWQDVPFRHVGARFVELETCRYRPRRALTRLLEGYDVVQVVAGAPCWAGVCRDVRVPVALQVATLIREERRELLARKSGVAGAWLHFMTRRVERLDERCLAAVDAIFVENHWMYDMLRSREGGPQVLFAPPGVDTEFFNPADEVPRAGILCVGRLSDPRKNVRLLFEAYARVVESRPDAPGLVLAGSHGPAAADWEWAERLGIRSRVAFHYRVSMERLAELYALSSDEEGLGLVILEAMSSGTPVVATECGGPSTSIRDGVNGFLVPRNDADALAARIVQLLDDPALARRLGEAARRDAVERFSLAASGALFLDCYDRLRAATGGRGGAAGSG